MVQIKEFSMSRKGFLLGVQINFSWSSDKFFMVLR